MVPVLDRLVNVVSSALKTQIPSSSRRSFVGKAAKLVAGAGVASSVGGTLAGSASAQSTCTPNLVETYTNKNAVIRCDNINLRSQPCTSSSVQLVIPVGSTVAVRGLYAQSTIFVNDCKPSVKSANWFGVTYQGVPGYIAAVYTDIYMDAVGF